MQDTSNVINKATASSMNRNLSGITVEEILKAKNYKIRFSVYETGKFMNSDLENLDLSVRSYNCLKRAGHHTVGDIVNSISSGEDLKRIRNCGTKSVDEIMLHLFAYNYECLSPEMQKKYMSELVMLNGINAEQ